MLDIYLELYAMRYRFFNMILFLLLTHSHTALDAAELDGRVVDAKGLGLERRDDRARG